LDPSENPTRNIKILDPTINLDSFLSFAQNYGEVANVDVCDFPHSVVISFYDLNCSMQFAQFLSSQNFKLFSELSFISSLNESSFYDYIVIFI